MSSRSGSAWGSGPALAASTTPAGPRHLGAVHLLQLVTLPVLPPAVSTKDLIETCCAAGQQWAIDNDECLDIPESGAESDVCR